MNIVNYLKTIDNPSTEILSRINAAVIWMTEAQLNVIEIVDDTNSEGETVTLDENGQASGCVQYTVFVTEYQEELATTTATEAASTETTTTEITATITETTGTTTETITVTEPGDSVYGDVNADGQFSLADGVMMQKFLLGAGTLNDYAAGELTEDDRLNGFDPALMKRAIMKRR